MQLPKKLLAVAFTLLCTALAQAQTQAQFQILNQGRVASTFPFGERTAEIIMEPFDDAKGNHLWEVIRRGDPLRVSFLNVQGPDVRAAAFVENQNSAIVASVDNETIWYLQPSKRDNEYLIKDPQSGLVWTNTVRGGGRDPAVFLHKADGSDDQLWTWAQVQN